MAAIDETSETLKRDEPIYFYNDDIDQSNGKWLDIYEICTACCDVLSESDHKQIVGAQRIGGLWQLYLRKEEVRLNSLSTGINLTGNQIVLKDRNPYLNLGMENIETTRLFIRNVLLSYDNITIEKGV